MTTQPGLDGLRLRHWKTDLRPDGVLVLSFDREGESVNTFGQDVLIELGDLLDRIVHEGELMPRLAAASMLGHSFPFTRWAASMRHKDLDNGQSVLLYTYTFEVGPRWMSWIIRPFVERIFEHQTRKRFARLRTYLASHAQEIVRWQQEQ